MKTKRKHKCRHCRKLYRPDPRTADRQKYCSEPECKRASKADRQRRWRGKSQNRKYFSGSHQVDRIRDWRKANPGYWKKKPPEAGFALQDDCQPQPVDHQEDKGDLFRIALQDDCQTQLPLIVGLIDNLFGSGLQDDIALKIRKFYAHGQSILGMGPGFECKGGDNDRQESAVPGTPAARAGEVQLGGSPVDPR